MKGPLNTNDFLKQRKFIIRKVQLHYGDTQMFKINQIKLYVKVSEKDCISVSAKYWLDILFLSPKESALTKKLDEEAQISTSTGE